jgi:prevent-host-death family protein
MTFRRVGAREANQQFSALLAAAEDNGETIVITRRGKAVARLIPEPHAQRQESEAIDALIERFARPMGGGNFSRDELYDRDDSLSR